MSGSGGKCITCKVSCVFREPKKGEDEIFGHPCDNCRKVYCKSCANFSPTEIRALILTNRVLPYFCPDCIALIGEAIKLQSKILLLETKISQLLENTEKNSKEIKEIIVRIDSPHTQAKEPEAGTNNSTEKKEASVRNNITLEQVEAAVGNALALVQSNKSNKLNELTRKPTINRGIASDAADDFFGEEEMMWLYIGNVTKKSNPVSVKGYLLRKLELNNENENELVVEQLNTMGDTNAYKIGIKSSLYHTVNDAQFWPSHVVFRRFFIRRSMAATNNTFYQRRRETSNINREYHSDYTRDRSTWQGNTGYNRRNGNSVNNNGSHPEINYGRYPSNNRGSYQNRRHNNLNM